MSLEMPKGRRYDFWAGHSDPLEPAPSDLDDVFIQTMVEYRAATPEEREAFTRSLGQDDSYLLQSFAIRAAPVALRTRSPELARAGLLAELAIDPHVIDYRDAGWPIAKLRYCMARLGMNAAEEFRGGLNVAFPAMADALSHQIPRVLSYRSLAEFRKHDLLAVEVETPTGPGFVDLHIEKFEPHCDVLGALVHAAGLLRSEPNYVREKVNAADDFPFHWIYPSEPPHFRLPAGVKAVANIHAVLRPEAATIHSRYGMSQMLWISIIEASSPEVAEEMAKSIDRARPGCAVNIGVAAGSLVGFVQGWIAEQDVELFETEATLERFCEPLWRILAETPPLSGSDPFEFADAALPADLLA